MQTDSTDYSPKPPVPAQIVDMTADESAAIDRLRGAGNGDLIGATLPEDDAYAVILFGWGPDDEIPYGRVLVSTDGRRYLPIDHGTALALREPGSDDDARAAYERYLYASGGKSIVSGADLPSYDALPEPIRAAWRAAADPSAPRLSR